VRVLRSKLAVNRKRLADLYFLLIARFLPGEFLSKKLFRRSISTCCRNILPDDAVAHSLLFALLVKAIGTIRRITKTIKAAGGYK